MALDYWSPPLMSRLQWSCQFFISQFLFQPMEIASRQDNVRKTNLPGNPNFINNQMNELQRTVSQLSAQNKKKYNQILASKPCYSLTLYKVNEPQSMHRAFGKELLLKQLDRLLEEENKLDRQLSLIRFRHEETEIKKEELIATEINSYQILKSVWMGGQRKYEGAVEHAQSLNEIVGHIRHSIKKMTEIESDSSRQSEEMYLKMYLQTDKSQEPCCLCKAQQQAKNQLRITIQTLQERISQLQVKNEACDQQIANKDDLIKKLSKKMLEVQTETRSKLTLLEEKLLLEDHQIKQLRRFKNDIQKNMFVSQIDNLQIYVKCQEDLAHYPREISLTLQGLLNCLIPEPVYVETLQTNQQNIEPPKNFDLGLDLMIPELSLSISGKANKKTSYTDRPKAQSRTQRQRASINQLATQRFEDIELLSKKYVRTSQLTTKRNNRPANMDYSMLASKCTPSTAKTGDSPKSMENENTR